MLKNFIIILVMIGALWSTPLSFTFQESWGLNTQIVSAIPAPITSVPATQLATREAQTPAEAFKLKCVYKIGINFGDCAAIIGYGLFYVPTSLVLIAGGAIFDAFMALSLDKFLLNQQFVKDTWGVVRDLANLVFILILLWIAVATILDMGGVQLKQAVINVVIVALLINFSYFFTRVVIDASNVVAWEFYSAIGGGGQVSSGNHVGGVTEYRISEKIVGAVSPQKLLSPEAFTSWSEKSAASKGYLFFLFLIGGIVNLVLAYVLFYAGFLLLGRVIAFVFLIIASPLAFISYALPKGGSFTGSWWNQLLSQAMVAPVFLFFLYVIVQLAGAGVTMFNTTASAPGGVKNFLDLLITILLKASIVVVALMIALNKTKSLSGAAGTWATKAGTAVAGTALAGTALAGRQVVGRGARWLQQKNVLGDGAVGRTADRALGAMASGTMDLRGLPGGKYMGLGGVKFGKGGIKKSIDAAERRKTEFAARRMNAIDPETGKSRGDTQVEAGGHATDKEVAQLHKNRLGYDVAMVRRNEQIAKDTKEYEEKQKTYEKEVAQGRSPIKPVKPTAPPEPIKPPSAVTISARERLARQHGRSWSASSKASAENIRKGKTGKDYEEDDERKEFKEWKKEKKESGEAKEKEVKESDSEGDNKPEKE